MYQQREYHNGFQTFIDKQVERLFFLAKNE